MINTHGFVGYFQDKLDIPYKVTITHPDTLWGATSMTDEDASNTSDVFTTPRYAVLVENTVQAMAFSNVYAPEHLILASDAYQELIPLIGNAGSVFLGNLTPESAGDYASGTNHTLPTSGFAKAYSGVSMDSFLKKITFQHISPHGLAAIGPSVEILAAAEGLQGHKNAITIRLKSTDGY